MSDRWRRSRSRSSNRRVGGSRVRTRSSSRDIGGYADSKRACKEFHESNSFYVPFRCLVPPNCAGCLIGKGGVIMDRISKDSGAQLTILSVDKNPKGLEDRIISISGTLKKKEAALSIILSKVREYYRKSDFEKDLFVCLVPDKTVSLFGSSVLFKLSDRSGCYKIDLCSKPVARTTDRAITIDGSLKSIVSAVSHIDGIIQDFCDAGNLTKADFSFCHLFPSKQPVLPRITVDPNFDSRVPLIVGISESEADWATQSVGLALLRGLEKEHNVRIQIPQTPGDLFLEISGTHEAKKKTIGTILQHLPRKRNFYKKEKNQYVVVPKGSEQDVLDVLDAPLFTNCKSAMLAWNEQAEPVCELVMECPSGIKESHCGEAKIVYKNKKIYITGKRSQIAIAVFHILQHATSVPEAENNMSDLDYDV